jgi:drug/metabolite transporter (DMT)-like permease
VSRRGWVLFGLMCFIWGIPYLLIKVAVDEVSVPVLVFARIAIGAALLVPLAMRNSQFASLRGNWKPVVAFAAMEMLVPWALLSDAERHISSGLAGLMIAATPIIAVIVGALAGDDDRLDDVARLVGLGLGIVGVFILALPELRGGSVKAMIELGIVAVLYATAPRIIARRLADVPSLPITAACLALGTVVYAAPAALTWPQAMPSGPVLAALIGLGVICTGSAFVVFFALIREVGPARALVFTYVNPAVAVAAGVLLLGEPLTLPIIAAFVLILGGSILATRTPKPGEPLTVEPV